ncbi:MAG: AAA family ATPase [Gemmatimonadetes bacterium]|nr:AAA family ATPase [Gemmatimonadota bacterium]
MAPAAAGHALSLHALRGHEGARAALARAYARGVLPSALLFHGPRGVGKQRLALWLAQLLVCELPGEGPCGSCPACKMAASLEHPDVHWYFPLPRPKSVAGDRLVDALEEARLEELAAIREQPRRASHTDEVRGLYVGTVRSIRQKAYKRPVMAPGQVFIIGDADALVPQEASPEAANALLKVLEEPPGNCRFILTTSEAGHLPPTIPSRTVPLHLAPLSEPEVAAFLRDEAGAGAKEADWAAGLSQGSIGRALGFLPEGGEPGPLEKLRRQAFEIVAATDGPRASTGHVLALGFPPAGARTLVELFGFVEEWLRDLAAIASGARETVIHRDALAELDRLAAKGDLVPYRVATAFSQVERARELAVANVNPQLVVGSLVRELRHSLAQLPSAEVPA